MDVPFLGPGLYRRVALIAGIVQHQRRRTDELLGQDLPQQFAPRLGVDHRGIGHRSQRNELARFFHWKQRKHLAPLNISKRNI